MPNFGWKWPTSSLTALLGWWLTQGWKNQLMIRKGIMAGIYEAVPGRRSREQWEEDTEEPHCPGTEVLEGLVGRIKDTVRSLRSSGPPGPKQTRPPTPGPCARPSARGVWLPHHFLLPEPQPPLTLGSAQTWGFRSGLRPSCAHIYGGGVPWGRGWSTQASGRAGVWLLQKGG